MINQRKKPQLLMWTQTWRRLNKKGKDEGVTKKKYVNISQIQLYFFEYTLKLLN